MRKIAAGEKPDRLIKEQSPYQASHSPEWLKWAVALTGQQIKLFWNEQGGFFSTAPPTPSVKIRMRDRYDGAEPAGSSYNRSRLVLLADGGENQAYLAEKLSFMTRVVRLDNKATADVCTDFTCRMPVTEAKALQLQLEGKKA